jgi:hypothetical protein
VFLGSSRCNLEAPACCRRSGFASAAGEILIAESICFIHGSFERSTGAPTKNPFRRTNNPDLRFPLFIRDRSAFFRRTPEERPSRHIEAAALSEQSLAPLTQRQRPTVQNRRETLSDSFRQRATNYPRSCCLLRRGRVEIPRDSDRRRKMRLVGVSRRAPTPFPFFFLHVDERRRPQQRTETQSMIVRTFTFSQEQWGGVEVLTLFHSSEAGRGAVRPERDKRRVDDWIGRIAVRSDKPERLRDELDLCHRFERKLKIQNILQTCPDKCGGVLWNNRRRSFCVPTTLVNSPCRRRTSCSTCPCRPSRSWPSRFGARAPERPCGRRRHRGPSRRPSSPSPGRLSWDRAPAPRASLAAGASIASPVAARPAGCRAGGRRSPPARSSRCCWSRGDTRRADCAVAAPSAPATKKFVSTVADLDRPGAGWRPSRRGATPSRGLPSIFPRLDDPMD